MAISITLVGLCERVETPAYRSIVTGMGVVSIDRGSLYRGVDQLCMGKLWLT